MRTCTHTHAHMHAHMHAHRQPTGKHFCSASEAPAFWMTGPLSQRGGCHHSGRMGGTRKMQWAFGRGISWIKADKHPMLHHNTRGIQHGGGGRTPPPLGRAGDCAVAKGTWRFGWRDVSPSFSLMSEQPSRKMCGGLPLKCPLVINPPCSRIQRRRRIVLPI
jgi:hypothetical protein